MRVIAFDPGVTTGIAIFEEGTLNYWGTFKSLKACVNTLHDFLRDDTRTTVVVMEAFNRGNTVVDEQIQTIELCGAITAICELKGAYLVRQSPSTRTSYLPIARAMLQSYSDSNKRHAIDAVAHAIRWMERNGEDWQKSYWMPRVFQ